MSELIDYVRVALVVIGVRRHNKVKTLWVLAVNALWCPQSTGQHLLLSPPLLCNRLSRPGAGFKAVGVPCLSAVQIFNRPLALVLHSRMAGSIHSIWSAKRESTRLVAVLKSCISSARLGVRLRSI